MTTSICYMVDAPKPAGARRASRLDEMRFTISVSPTHVRGGMDLLALHSVRERMCRVAHRIQDVNFTHHAAPYHRDAHGVFVTVEENEAHLRQMLALQEATGIVVSPVFNDITVPNTFKTLETFVESLKPLVDQGIRSISVPHVLWLKMGLIQKNFPGLTLKNTVLRRVRTAQDFWNHAEAGYDYVNLDRVLVRDQTELYAIRQAQRSFEERFGKRVLTSLLDAEGCLGACALWEEHYQHTLSHSRTDESVAASLEVFRYPQEFSCMAIGVPGDNFWMSVGLPYFREDLEAMCGLFDVIKLAGRRSFHSLGDCLTRIERFGSGDGPLVQGVPESFERLVRDQNMAPFVDRWREAVRGCRFQCWRCSICSELLARM